MESAEQIPPHFLQIFREFYDGMSARVTVGGHESDPFHVFNPSKSQIVTFGGQSQCQYQLALNDNPVPWVNRVTYLGVRFCCDTGYAELADFYRKFHDQFNSILSVLGKYSNEMTAVHLIKLTAYLD